MGKRPRAACLFDHAHFCAAILGLASLGGIGSDGTGLAMAYRGDAACADALLCEVAAHGDGAVLGKLLIGLGAAIAVGMPCELDFGFGIALHGDDEFIEHCVGLWADHGLGRFIMHVEGIDFIRFIFHLDRECCLRAAIARGDLDRGILLFVQETLVLDFVDVTLGKQDVKLASSIGFALHRLAGIGTLEKNRFADGRFFLKIGHDDVQERLGIGGLQGCGVLRKSVGCGEEGQKEKDNAIHSSEVICHA